MESAKAAPFTRTGLARLNGALLVLTASGVLGFRVGWVGFPDWQVAVETAQVVAGVVQYPAATPFFVYHTKLWTVLHQLLAVGFWLGLSEIQLSLVISGLLGMLSFQALSLVVFALSADVLLSVGAAFLIFFTRSSEFGAAYPIYVMGTSHTYGVVGLSLCVLIAGLLGVGYWRTGALLLGAAPSIHPSLGAWFVLIAAAAVGWDSLRNRRPHGLMLRYFGAGVAISVMSFVIQTSLMSELRGIERSGADRYLNAFVRLWDGHRQPLALNADAVILNIAALVAASLSLAFLSERLGQSSALLLRIIIVAGGLSLGLVFISWIPSDRLPANLLILMPTRLLNLNAFAAVAVGLGLIGAYRTKLWSPVLIAAVSAALLLNPRSMLWDVNREGGFWGAALAAPAWIGIAATFVVTAANTSRPRHLVMGVARGAVVVVLAMAAVLTWQVVRPLWPLFTDRTNEPLYMLAAQESGVLLTGGGLHLIQLRTRRPVLIDGGGLDGLPYALEAAAETERVLRDVYAIDFFDPPEEARGSGTLPRNANRAAWEQFTIEKWSDIKRMYNVTQVMTFADWTLKLPVVAQNRELRLYGIP